MGVRKPEIGDSGIYYSTLAGVIRHKVVEVDDVYATVRITTRNNDTYKVGTLVPFRWRTSSFQLDDPPEVLAAEVAAERRLGIR